MRYREPAEDHVMSEIIELEPPIWAGLDLWLADWKEEE